MTTATLDRTTRLLPSTAVVAGRALRRFIRTPQEIVAGTATMAMFILIFRYVFGGQIAAIGSLAYVDFLVPGYLATAALFTGMGTAAGVAEDLEQGVVDRLRSLPIPRTAFLAGRAVADTAVLVWSLFVAALVSFAIGFRIHGDTLDVLLAVVLLVVFGFGFVWLFIALGLFAGSAKGAQGLSFLVFPLTFVSSAYVQAESLPGVLRPFAEHQPLTLMINAVRGLVQGPAAEALLAHPTSTYVLRTLLWTAAILAVAVPGRRPVSPRVTRQGVPRVMSKHVRVIAATITADTFSSNPSRAPASVTGVLGAVSAQARDTKARGLSHRRGSTPQASRSAMPSTGLFPAPRSGSNTLS